MRGLVFHPLFCMVLISGSYLACFCVVASRYHKKVYSMRAFCMHNTTCTWHDARHNIFQQHSPSPFSTSGQNKPIIFFMKILLPIVHFLLQMRRLHRSIRKLELEVLSISNMEIRNYYSPQKVSFGGVQRVKSMLWRPTTSHLTLCLFFTGFTQLSINFMVELFWFSYYKQLLDPVQFWETLSLIHIFLPSISGHPSIPVTMMVNIYSLLCHLWFSLCFTAYGLCACWNYWVSQT